MRRFFTLFILILICSCQIQYDVSTRLVFEGQTKDRNGSPIENNDVEVWVYNSNESDFIGYSTTDANGNFIQVIPEPRNDKTKFKIKIENNSIYNQIEYVNILQSDFEDYKINIPDITLIANDDISQLEITLNQVNIENSIVDLELSGLVVNSIVWVNPPEEDNYTPYYSDSYHEQVAKNQTLNLYYEVRNGNTGQVDSYNENIEVGSDDLAEYTINF